MNYRVIIWALGVISLLCAFAGRVSAQQQGTQAARFWIAELEGGSYMVALSSISAVGKHTFLVPGAGRVHEVTVDTTGSVTARFYYIEELPAQAPAGIGQGLLEQARQRVEELKERISPAASSLAPWQQVVKNYPDATHAHTIEFRVASLKVLNDLHENLSQALLRGRGDRFKSP